MRLLPTRLPCLCLLLAGLGPSLALAQAGQPAAWELVRGQSTVLLLGSIHVLPASRAELPPLVEDLYARADTLVMELAMDQLDPVAFQQEVSRLGRQPEGRTLADSLGEARWTEASRLARDIDLDLDMLGGVKPWLAALTVTQLRLMQMGFSPEFGIEVQLTGRATRDAKPISGLETTEEQLAVFAGLPDGEQAELLLQSLADAVSLEEDVALILSAWLAGDLERMERELLDSVRAAPSLYEAVVVERNRNWIEPIEALLARPGTHLVVVGALHLVGEDSVVAMLEARGHSLKRLQGGQISVISKSSLPDPQSGQRQDSGTSSQRVPGGRPASGSPLASS
jgi:uncharacterized protein